LNGRRGLVPGALDARQQAGIQIELVEVHDSSCSSEVKRVSGGSSGGSSGTATATAEMIDEDE